MNPTHPLVERANELAADNPADGRVETWITLLYDLASLAEGAVPDPAATVARIQAELETVARAERGS